MLSRITDKLDEVGTDVVNPGWIVSGEIRERYRCQMELGTLVVIC